MGSLDPRRISQLDKYLDEQGLTFAPLREEILDHLLSDLQDHMDQGKTFEEAWSMITDSIPPQHFKTLQTETMETLNKRFNLSKVFTYLSLSLLAVASLFKLFHLQGTTVILISSLVAIGAALLVSSLSGIYLYREKKGRWLMLGIIAGILLFLTSWIFVFLRLPGGRELLTASVVILVILFPALTIYFGSHLKSENNILTYLHQKHIPGIERFLLILLGLATVLRISSMVFEYPPNVSRVLLVLLICGAGLQYFGLTWHPNTLVRWGSSKWLQGLLIAAFIVFILPALGAFLNLPIRASFVMGFYAIAGLLAVIDLETNSKKVYFSVLVAVVILFHLGWWLIQMQFIDVTYLSFLFNLPGLLVLMSGILFSRKHTLLRTYMIIVTAHYLLEYPATAGLW